MLDLKLAVLVVHRVELTLELETQLHFFLMVLSVLHVLLFKFESLVLLFSTVLLELVIVVSQCFHVLIENFLFVDVVLNLFFESFLDECHLSLMLVCDFSNQDPVIGLATVLEKHLVDLPYRSNDLIIVLGSLQNLLQELKEADRVNKERPVNPVNLLIRDP